MIKILTVVGARPQLIKAAAISRCIRDSFRTEIEEIVIHTGQHYDENMSQVFFDELEIPKEKYNLEVGSGSHAAQTAKMMVGCEEIFLKENPDYILLYGDTNSTVASALVASKLFIPIIHIEAGVRSYNKDFPEEVNRIMTDHLSTYLFTPTQSGYDSLVKEGFKHDVNEPNSYNNPVVLHCDDIMYDNTLFYKSKASLDSFKNSFDTSKPFVLVTLHRPSNVDTEECLTSILEAIVELEKDNGFQYVLPLHPRTKSKIDSLDNPVKQIIQTNENIKVTPPVSFIEMIALEDNSELVITDSGGVQKEAYYLEKPCVIMLDETPWVELVESGSAELTGSNKNKIISSFKRLYENRDKLTYPPIFGNGEAAKQMLTTILEGSRKNKSLLDIKS